MGTTVLDKNGFVISFCDYENIVIPQNCIGFTDRAYDDLYATASERKSIAVEKGNKKFKSEKNCLIDIEEGKVVLGCINSIIPDDGSIKIIGHHSFIGIGDIECENRDIFTHIDIPKGVEIIEHHAFADSGLLDINLPDGLKIIGSMAFMLTRVGEEGKTIFLPETIEEMGIGVFSGCRELRRAKIFSERYKSENDCIVDTQTKTIVAVHNGISGEILPLSAEIIESLAFMGQNKGTKYYFEENIKEIKMFPIDIPTEIEFPITMVAHKDSYAHKFAVEHRIDHEIWK